MAKAKPSFTAPYPATQLYLTDFTLFLMINAQNNLTSPSNMILFLTRDPLIVRLSPVYSKRVFEHSPVLCSVTHLLVTSAIDF